jgi:hypothetical protein
LHIIVADLPEWRENAIEGRLDFSSFISDIRLFVVQVL